MAECRHLDRIKKYAGTDGMALGEGFGIDVGHTAVKALVRAFEWRG
jgi:hypothetical protein